MKKTPVSLNIAALLLFSWAGTAYAQISVVNSSGGFLGSNKSQVTTAHNGTTEVVYDSTGVSKLVVTIGSEGGNNATRVTNMAVRFEGVAMTRAVLGNTWTTVTNDCGGAAIFYLDNPPQVAAGKFAVTVTPTSGGPNGGRLAILGLSGTESGVGSVSATGTSRGTAGNVSGSLTTTRFNSLAIAMMQNSGSNNVSGTTNVVVSPLAQVNNGHWGSYWGTTATGQQSVSYPSTITPTFTTGSGGNIQIVAAEFVPVSVDVPSNPAPVRGVVVPGGPVNLTWTNLAPTQGEDVLVDVWFGTDPQALVKVVDAASDSPNRSSTTVSTNSAGTYIWRVDTYRDGAATGTPETGTFFHFIVNDSDNDGMLDSWETQYFGQLVDPGDNPDVDGLTNLQEFQLGTLPNNPDTDGDGLIDGVETNTGVWAGATDTGTNPLVFDTDGDTIRDGYETNTGIWVSGTNTGTHPLNRDTDLDSLSDGVETNTGTFVSNANTGTQPLHSDTDTDSVGDWYEITATFTDPLSAASKPRVPYPLPDPDASTGAANKPVKVYIMSGQSNMVGEGTISGTDTKSLETMTRRENKFPNLIDGSGDYLTRQDVRYRGVIAAIGDGPLAPGFGKNTGFFGPELGFGHIMGWHKDEPVLLIKASLGGRGLGSDILPPGGVRYTYDLNTYPAYGESPAKWLTSSGAEAPSNWYAGINYDDFFLHESQMGARPWVSGTAYPGSCRVMHNGLAYVSRNAHTASAASEPGVGASWASSWNVYSPTNVVDVLDDFAGQYPQWASQGFEIAGFVWWQGDKDRYDTGHSTLYEQNLVRLINSLRSYYGNRYPGKVVPNAPFVLATLGQTKLNDPNPIDPDDPILLNAMLAVDGETGNYPQFKGNVKTVYSNPLSEGGESNGHYNQRAGTYMLIGDALGRAMLDLEFGASFAGWMAGFGVAPALAGFNQDADGDGIRNGVENFFGTPPNASSAGVAAGAASGNTFIFTHPRNPAPGTGVTAAYRWSKDLVTFRSHGATDEAGTTVNFNAITSDGITTVTATVIGTPADRLFVDIEVIQN